MKEGRGFVFALDGMFAVTMIVLSIVVLQSHVSRFNNDALSDAYLVQISRDTLTVIEKQGFLDEAVRTNSSANMTKILRETPRNICMQVRLTNSTSGANARINGVKANCTSYSGIVVSAKRSVVVVDSSSVSFWTAQIDAWYSVPGTGGI